MGHYFGHLIPRIPYAEGAGCLGTRSSEGEVLANAAGRRFICYGGGGKEGNCGDLKEKIDLWERRAVFCGGWDFADLFSSFLPYS